MTLILFLQGNGLTRKGRILGALTLQMQRLDLSPLALDQCRGIQIVCQWSANDTVLISKKLILDCVLCYSSPLSYLFVLNPSTLLVHMNDNRTSTSKILPVLSVVSLALTMWGQSASGASIVWDGGGSDDSWTTPENWVGDVVPDHSDWRDDAVFNSTSSPTTVTVTSGRYVGGMRFETAGWEVGNIQRIKRLYSTGTGVSMNTIGSIGEVRANETWDVVGVDHTLKVGAMYLAGNSITLQGGGTLWTTAQLNGYGSTSFTVQAGTLRVDSTAAYTSSSGGIIHLAADTGYLQLANSNIASVEAMFGSTIIDDTGSGLQAFYDGATGYTTVSVVPEPESFALLAGVLVLVTIMVKRRG